MKSTRMIRAAGILLLSGAMFSLSAQRGDRGDKGDKSSNKGSDSRGNGRQQQVQRQRGPQIEQQQSRQRQPQQQVQQRSQPQSRQQQAVRQPQQQFGQRQPQRSQQQARSWQDRRGWQQQGSWRGAQTWDQSRARSWTSDHRSWSQRGGYGGYYIPQDRFYTSFGSQNYFRIRSRPIIYQGYPRFYYGGYSFLLVDPWPEYWAYNWYETDDVFIDYYDDGYYLYNRRQPGVRLAVTIAF